MKPSIIRTLSLLASAALLASSAYAQTPTAPVQYNPNSGELIAPTAAAFRTANGIGTGTGTVTTVSVATANGISGTVSNPTTAPAITLSAHALYDTAGTPLLSVDGANRQLVLAGVPQIDWSIGEMHDTLDVPSLKWTARSLFDAAGGLAGNWDDRVLDDAAGVFAIDWKNRLIVGPGAENLLEWTGANTGGTSTYWLDASNSYRLTGSGAGLTGIPISTGISGLGTGVAAYLGTPSIANLLSATPQVARTDAGQSFTGEAQSFPTKTTTDANSTLVIGDTINAVTLSGRAKVTVGNSGGNSELLLGQDATHAVLFDWQYNATAGSAIAEMATYAYSNRLNIDGAALYLQSSSGGPTFVSGALILPTSATPASATASGTTGTICWDSSYIYVCVATNTWKRVALATW